MARQDQNYNKSKHGEFYFVVFYFSIKVIFYFPLCDLSGTCLAPLPIPCHVTQCSSPQVAAENRSIFL